MHKKILFVLSALAFTASVNAAELKNPEAEAEVNNYLNKVKINQVKKEPFYGYFPVVFELKASYLARTYEKSVDINNNETKVTVASNPDNGSIKNYKCSGTLINNTWLVTDKRCVALGDLASKDPDYSTNFYSYKLKELSFTRGDYYAEVEVSHSNLQYYIDDSTGTAWLNIGTLCLSKTPKQRTNVCVNLWDSLIGKDNGTFYIHHNYSSVILTNITEKDYSKPAFKNLLVTKSYMSPKLGGFTIGGVSGNALALSSSLAEKNKPLAGEPVFHKNLQGQYVLVAINTAATGSARHFAFLGKGFTETARKALGKNASKVILTTDLEGKRKI